MQIKTLEDVEKAIEDYSIYTFDKSLLEECLKIVSAKSTSGNPNHNTRLLRTRVKGDVVD